MATAHLCPALATGEHPCSQETRRDTGKGASLESAEQDRLSSWRGTRDMGQGAGKREPGGDEPGEDEPEFYQQRPVCLTLPENGAQKNQTSV